jgi:hypothetical protein
VAGYAYITLYQLRSALLNRLQDAGAVYTTTAEANLYLQEALRVLNALTAAWPTDFVLNFNPGDRWKSLNFAGSPRQRTLTDAALYTQMQAMLLEPMSGGTWTGTAQYNIAMLAGALAYRRDELLLASSANVVNLLMPSPALSTRTYLPDSTLDLLRVRWIPVDSTAAMPYALGREDIVTRNAFGVQLPIQPGEPDSWMITATTPPAFDVSCPPNQPGQWDLLLAFSGTPFAPPVPQLINLPDDWAWVAMYGALADVLSNAPEGRDAERAKYCQQRYEEGKKAMLTLPWLLQAMTGGVSIDTLGFKEIDTQWQNWEQRQPASDPQIVVGGMDLVALAPFPTTASVSTMLTVVQNAPVPVNDTDLIQLSRDGVDAVLAYAQHIALFKAGGADFAATLPLYAQFEQYCKMKNAMYSALSMDRRQLLGEGNRQDEDDPRFEPEGMTRGKKAR